MPDELVDADGAAARRTGCSSWRARRARPSELERALRRSPTGTSATPASPTASTATSDSERTWPLSPLPLILAEERLGGRSPPASTQRAAAARGAAARPLRRRRAWSPTARCRPPSSPAAPTSCGRCVGVKPPRRPLPAALRRRSRPRPGRPLVGAGRPHPGAVRRRLCAGEPAGDVARLSRPLQRHERRAAGAASSSDLRAGLARRRAERASRASAC